MKWENAWDEHEQNWKSPPPLSEEGDGHENLTHIYHLNSLKEIMTEDEQKTKPYPSYAMTICFSQTRVTDVK